MEVMEANALPCEDTVVARALACPELEGWKPIANTVRLDHMSTTVMQDSSRSPAQVKDGGDSETARESKPVGPPAANATAAGSSAAPALRGGASSGEAKPAGRSIGHAHAMKALFESSDVSIKRGDETRVMSRAQEALAEIHRKTNPPPRAPQPTPASVPPTASPSSRPPAPRVDAVLWLVLAVGLFAIAGWMVAYGL
jgi:hypothetical protein